MGKGEGEEEPELEWWPADALMFTKQISLTPRKVENDGIYPMWSVFSAC